MSDHSQKASITGFSLLPLACLALVLSGAAALVLEVVWTRRLELVIGHTYQAAAVTASLYMAGLGAGAWLAGRFLRPDSRPWKGYLLCEFGIALWALLSLLLLPALSSAAPPLARLLSSSEVASVPVLLRLVIAGIILLPPTLLMGATIPLLVRAARIDHEDLEWKGGLLYGFNTLGACLGAVLAGFVLVPNVGLKGATLMAAVLGVGAAFLGGAGMIISGKEGGSPDPDPARDRADDSASAPPPWVPIVLAALAGFVALWLQILWYRSLALVSGTSVYALATVLAVVLAAVGLGPLLLGWPARLLSRHSRWLPLALLFTLSGLALHFAALRFGGAPTRFLESVSQGMVWGEMLRLQIRTAIGMILPTALLLSTVLPVAARLVAENSRDSARAVSLTLAANTVGALLGGIAGGYLLLPLLGLQKGFVAAGLLLVITGLAITFIGLRGPVRFFLGSSLAMITALVGLFAARPWDPSRFALGSWFAPGIHGSGGSSWEQLMQTTRLVHYDEGLSSTSAVLEGHRGNLHYLSDGKVEADTGMRGLINQRLVGHLPLLFHPGTPQEILNIGLGAGTTAGALASHPEPERITVVELEPSAVEAARAFSGYNDRILEEPRLRLLFGDARNHLYATTRSYDVISSDPFEPVVAGAMQLFTLEHYQQLRERLAPDGVVSQWIPMYEMSPRDYQSLLTTFLEVFPDSLFFSTGADSILLGFKSGGRATPDQVAERFGDPEVAASLGGLGFDTLDKVLGLLVADFAQTPASEWVEPGDVLTDNRPRVEFSAPKHVFVGDFRRNRGLQIRLLEKSLALAEGDQPDAASAGVLRERRAVLDAMRAGRLLGQGVREEALEAARSAMTLSPTHPLVREECSEVFHETGLAALHAGDVANAHRLLSAALAAKPDDFQTLHRLTLLEMGRGNLGAAGALIADGRRRFPRSPYFEMVRAAWADMQKNHAEAAEACEEAIRRAPRLEGAWEQYRQIAEKSGKPEIVERYQRFTGLR